jgi:Peptidase family C25
LICAALVVVVLTARAADAGPAFKIYVEYTGVYEVSFERLVESGLDGPLPSVGIGLENFGEPVAVWVTDGGDGLFGPGDRLLFMGEVLRGAYSYLDPYSRFNCYRLSFDHEDPLRGETRTAGGTESEEPARFVAKHHLESDQVMVRFRTRADAPEESWYWERLSVVDKKPFRQELVFDGFARREIGSGGAATTAESLSESIRAASGDDGDSSAGIRSRLQSVFNEGAATSNPIHIRLGLRGWSEPRHRERTSLPHHEIEILINDMVVERATWDGKDHFIHEVAVPAERVLNGPNDLSIRIPKRLYPESGDLVVDVVLLNWIEVEYPHLPLVGDDQRRLFPVGDGGRHRVVVEADDSSPVDLFLPSGVRYRSDHGVLSASIEVGDGGFALLKPSAAAPPNDVILDRPSNLRNDDQQVDYIMVTHSTLLEKSRRLAEFHRGRGLSVALVDVQDIYDEFNFGVLDPRAIKDFLQYAHSTWRAPSPRFVLFVGDASWDFKNLAADDANYADWTYRTGEMKKFIKNSSTRYAEGADLNHRNLVPTSSFPTLEGHAASDTWFVCFDDGDNLPDMAVGRLPVTSVDELDSVIDKTIGFTAAPPVGPWKRNLLFIANESVSFQRRSDLIAAQYGERGFNATRIYPHPSEPANEHHTRRIIEILDDGVYAVHFIGHGGRYIWRTGPPDLEKNHDLFTLDHLDKLAENDRLPVVLSLTCYSAPFDHPTADSIGEKLMRIPGRGAVAVFAASWRNSPSPIMGEILLGELTTPGNTIGESVMRAKHQFRSDVLVQTYNLLGDPAVPVAAPSHTLDLGLEAVGASLVLTARMPVPVESGHVIADWVGADGTVLREDRVEVSGTEFTILLDPGVMENPEQVAGVRVYVWDDGLRIDGIGWVGIPVRAGTAEMAEDDGRFEHGGAEPGTLAELARREER